MMLLPLLLLLMMMMMMIIIKKSNDLFRQLSTARSPCTVTSNVADNIKVERAATKKVVIYLYWLNLPPPSSSPLSLIHI